MIYLLLHKRLPDPEESEAFRAELAHRAEEIPTGALRVLESLTPGSGHPMDWLAIGIMALGAADSTGDARADSMNLIARMPELMARLFLLRGGKSEDLRPRKPELGLVENFVHMLGIEKRQSAWSACSASSSFCTWIMEGETSPPSPARRSHPVAPQSTHP